MDLDNSDIEYETTYVSNKIALPIILVIMAVLGGLVGYFGIFGKFNTVPITMTVYIVFAVILGLIIFSLYAIYKGIRTGTLKSWYSLRCGPCSRCDKNQEVA